MRKEQQVGVWICSQCCFSRVGSYHKKASIRQFDGMELPHMEICCQDCWDAWLALDPAWDWSAEGWVA